MHFSLPRRTFPFLLSHLAITFGLQWLPSPSGEDCFLGGFCFSPLVCRRLGLCPLPPCASSQHCEDAISEALLGPLLQLSGDCSLGWLALPGHVGSLWLFTDFLLMLDSGGYALAAICHV